MFRTFITFTVIVLIWHVICLMFDLPSFILPSPRLVTNALFNNFFEILNHSYITLLEIILSLLFGIILGSYFAILISISETLKRWIMPILLASQSIPVFALAPILVLWFGYGITSKIVIGTIIVFFPIASNFSDALNKIPKIEPHNVLCIGDSVEHDIRGSFNANCSSALVKTGIAATKKNTDLLNSDNLSDIPNFIIPAFSF